VGAELFRADGRTDVTKLRAAFSEFFWKRLKGKKDYGKKCSGNLLLDRY
jgi:hypothetical protein